MKKTLLLTILIILLLISCKKNENTPNNKNFVNVGIYVYHYPFGYLSNDNIAGIDYDLMNEISKISGSNIKFTPMSFEELIPALESKKIDTIIAGMTVTEERKKYMDFSDGYYNSMQALLVRADNETIKSESDLTGKLIGVIANTISDTMISENTNLTIERLGSSSALILALKVGTIDAAVSDRETCNHFIKYDNTIKLVDTIKFPEEYYAVAFRKEENPFLPEVNKALSIIKTNGFYKQLLEKHLGTNQ